MKIGVVLLLVLLSGFMNTAMAATPYVTMSEESYLCGDVISFDYYWADNSTFRIYKSTNSFYDYNWWSYVDDPTEYNGSSTITLPSDAAISLTGTYIMQMYSESTVWNATSNDSELVYDWQSFDTFTLSGCLDGGSGGGGTGDTGGSFDPFAGSNNQSGKAIPVYDFQSWFDVDGDGEYDYAEMTQSFRNWGMISFLGSLFLVITKFILRMPLW